MYPDLCEVVCGVLALGAVRGVHPSESLPGGKRLKAVLQVHRLKEGGRKKEEGGRRKEEIRTE